MDKIANCTTWYSCGSSDIASVVNLDDEWKGHACYPLHASPLLPLLWCILSIIFGEMHSYLCFHLTSKPPVTLAIYELAFCTSITNIDIYANVLQF